MKEHAGLGTRRRSLLAVAAALLIAANGLTAARTNAQTLDQVRAEERLLLTYLKTDWDKVLELARGQTVKWWFWNGDQEFNKYVSQWVADQVKSRYDITLVFVPIKDTVEGVNQVVNERNAGKHIGGSVDMQWISSENMKTMIQGDLFFEGWPWLLPNSRFVDYGDPTIADQGGLVVGNTGQVWERYQYVFVYDGKYVTNPPTTFAGLLDWCKVNPGRFTYPAPPDFTGRGVLTSLLYELSGGYEQWLGPFDQALWDKWSPALWNYLNEMKPCLWRNGETYPETVAVQDQLYASGELWWTHNYLAGAPARNVLKGAWPETTRTMVVDIGTLSGTGSVAIPYNSSSKAAAIVVADFLTSPEAQYEKAIPTGVGDGWVIDLALLPPEWQQKFHDLPVLPASLPAEVLASHQTPTATSYHVPIEEGWHEYVLRGQPYAGSSN